MSRATDGRMLEAPEAIELGAISANAAQAEGFQHQRKEKTMSSPTNFRSHLTTSLASIVLLCLVLSGAGAVAQGIGPPPPDATPGSVDLTGPELGAIEEPAAAPGYRLLMSEVVFAPGAYATRHTHPSASIVCVVTGTWGIMIHSGAATVTRAGTGDTLASVEPMELNTEVILDPRDCVSMDEIANRTEHTVWNAGDTETALWVTDLYKTDAPFTTFVDEGGTPVS